VWSGGFSTIRRGCGNILQLDKRRGYYSFNNLDYSFCFKDVKVSVGIFDSMVEFLNIAYSTP